MAPVRFPSLAALLAAALAVSAPAAADYAFVTATSEIWRIDLLSGDREHLDIDAYPGLIAVRCSAVESDASVVLAGYSAAQFSNIFRFAFPSGALSPISGDVLADPPNWLGDGPMFATVLDAVEIVGESEVVVLGRNTGLLDVDLATGQRTVVSQSVHPPVGTGYWLGAPLDFVVLPDGDFLVVEAFQGILRVERATGDRILAIPASEFSTTPELIVLLPDDRIAHLNAGQDSGFLFAYNVATQTDELLTGDFGGNARGDGPTFLAPSDIVLGPDGSLLVYDLAPPGIYAVDPKTGDRTLVSGGPADRGNGFGLPTVEFHPRLAARPPRRTKDPGDAWCVR